jgi:hypothetical protein
MHGCKMKTKIDCKYRVGGASKLKLPDFKGVKSVKFAEASLLEQNSVGFILTCA